MAWILFLWIQEPKQLDRWKVQSRFSVELIILKRLGHWRVCVLIIYGFPVLNAHRVNWFWRICRSRYLHKVSVLVYFCCRFSMTVQVYDLPKPLSKPLREAIPSFSWNPYANLWAMSESIVVQSLGRSRNFHVRVLVIFPHHPVKYVYLPFIVKAEADSRDTLPKHQTVLTNATVSRNSDIVTF